MSTKLIAVACVFFLMSCKSGTDSNPTATGTENPAKSPTDVAAAKKALNEQSLACIALMNALEVKQHAAEASGDATSAKAYAASIDSAAMENAKIGQKLMDLDK